MIDKVPSANSQKVQSGEEWLGKIKENIKNISQETQDKLKAKVDANRREQEQMQTAEGEEFDDSLPSWAANKGRTLGEIFKEEGTTTNTDKLTEQYIKRETDKTVEDYEMEIRSTMKYEPEAGEPMVEKPDTPEFKHHDKEMEKLSQDYDTKNPPPDSGSESGYRDTDFFVREFDNRSPEYKEWAEKKSEYMNNQEAKYREEHPEYAKQAQAYKNVQEEALRRSMTTM